MARFDIADLAAGTVGASRLPGADILFEMGVQSAAGRDGAADLVAAHMYFNLAARTGSDEAAQRRQEVAGEMSKAEIAKALRAARDWLTLG